MTSRSRLYFKNKKRTKTITGDWVVDIWTEKIRKEIDRLVLEELIEMTCEYSGLPSLKQYE